jgi:thiamine-monophosphate kinase
MEEKSIETLGEFGLIDHLTRNSKQFSSGTHLGIGDDCAVLMANDEEYLLVSKELLLEGIHFDLTYVPLSHLGFKAISASVSDIYAMNGKPTQVLVGLGVSSRFTLEAVDSLYEGIHRAAAMYGVDLVGGDTTSSVNGLTLSVTVLGSVAKGKITYRKGASVNDILMVSGDLGRAYLGLQVLEREKAVFMANPTIQPELDAFDFLVKKQLMPEARKDVVEVLAALGVTPTSMIDISDGLASEALHLCKASALGCVLFENKMPYHEDVVLNAETFGLAPLTCAMNGGEDYELLFSVSPQDFEQIKGNPHFTPIGYFTDLHGGAKLQDNQGALHEITAQGWRHF